MSEMCSATHHQHSLGSSIGGSDPFRPKGLQKRKGLSKYYASKSQSFSSLELALSSQYGESALGLAKRPSSNDLTHMRTATSRGGTANDLPDSPPHSSCLHSHSQHSPYTHQSGYGIQDLYCNQTVHHSLTASSSCLHTGVDSSVSCPPSSCPSMDSKLSDSLVPNWVHQTTEELCVALRRSSLVREPGMVPTHNCGASSPPILMRAALQHLGSPHVNPLIMSSSVPLGFGRGSVGQPHDCTYSCSPSQLLTVGEGVEHC